MDFQTLQLDEETKTFWREVREWVDTNVTPELREQFWIEDSYHDHDLYRKLGEKGWIMGQWPRERGGAGLTRLQDKILHLEMDKAEAPVFTWGLTHLILPAVLQFGSPEVQQNVVTKVASGDARFFLGYTEPDSGSDMAAAKIRAVRDGDEWVINGAKMFNTGGQFATHHFLLARSNPNEKHRGLTMFLVPLDTPGIELRPIRTISGERTNFVFYSDVRLSDSYRLGPEGDGWNVVNGPLSEEHSVSVDRSGLNEISGFAQFSLRVIDLVHRVADHERRGGRSKDPMVRLRLAEAWLAAEAARNSPAMLGRVIGSEVFQKYSADLIDLVGPAAVVPRGGPGVVADGWVEREHRFAQGTAIYGGTTDIFRNMIAQHVLGLPRPPKPATASRN
jgi:alkylation response protein AidB-like acyl-CoA dehydrogenase